MIIGNELGITELPHELSNDLRLESQGLAILEIPHGGGKLPTQEKKKKKRLAILGIQEIPAKSQNFVPK